MSLRRHEVQRQLQEHLPNAEIRVAILGTSSKGETTADH